jgi:hypothetical protein
LYFLHNSSCAPEKEFSGTVGPFPIVKLEFDLFALLRFWLKIRGWATLAKIVQVKFIAAIIIYPSD